MAKLIALFATVIAISGAAYAQGAAEAGLSHAMSTSLGTVAGKALGNATSQMTNRVAGRLGQQPGTVSPRNVVTHIRPGLQGQETTPALPASTTQVPVGGSLIQSIQGAAPQTCISTAPGMQQTPGVKEAGTNAKKGTCPSPLTSYQSEVTLPAPK
jgi:hypothetical protein